MARSRGRLHHRDSARTHAPSHAASCAPPASAAIQIPIHRSRRPHLPAGRDNLQIPPSPCFNCDGRWTPLPRGRLVFFHCFFLLPVLSLVRAGRSNADWSSLFKSCSGYTPYELTVVALLVAGALCSSLHLAVSCVLFFFFCHSSSSLYWRVFFPVFANVVFVPPC